MSNNPKDIKENIHNDPFPNIQSSSSSMSSDTSSNQTKERIRVYVMVGPETSGVVTTVKEISGEKHYKGFLWDVFKEVRSLPQIKDKYDFDFTFSESGKNFYGKLVDEVKDDKYDIVIGGYIHTIEREKLINYTSPIAIDSIAVFHYQKSNTYETFKEIFISISLLVAILIALGFVSGLFLYFVNPKRISKTNSKSKTDFFFRSVMTGIATFFGEMGYLSENTTNNVKGIVLVVCIMLIAFIYILFLQAEITSRVIERKTSTGLDKESLSDKPILGHKGYAMAQKVQEHGGIIEYVEGKTNQDLFDMYKFNPEKYNGIAMSYSDGYPYTKILSNLYATLEFGNEPVSLIVNQNKPIFLDDINRAILYIRSKGIVQNICFSYFGDIPHVPVCTLN